MYKYFIVFLLGIMFSATGILYYNSQYPFNSSNSEVQRLPQNQDYTYTIGLLGQSETIKTVFEGFKTQMEDIVKEKDITIKYETLDIGFSKTNTENATEYFIKQNVDLIITGQSEFIIMKEMGLKIPVVIAPAANVVQAGFAKSMKGSGTNAAFVESGNTNTAGQRLDFFMRIAPLAKTILILRGDPSIPGESETPLEDLKNISSKYNLTLIDKSFKDREGLNKFILSFDFKPIDAVFRYPGPFMASSMDLIFKFTSKINKPIITLTREELSQGGALSYAPDYKILGSKAADAAYQILTKKTAPGSIPVQTPIKFDLGLNETILNSFGLSIPEEARQEADYIIK